MLQLKIVLSFVGLATHLASACDTQIPEQDRIDCNVRPNDQSTCESFGCVWCPNVPGNIASCFLNITDSFNVILAAAANCKTQRDCNIAINCHPDKIPYSPNPASCESRGCLWLGNYSIADQPRCVYYNNSIIDGYNLFSGAFPMIETSAMCISCDRCYHKINCLPNELEYRITENRCQREGCLWCPATKECLFGATSGLDILGPKCVSCDNCVKQAYIKAGKEAICASKRGTWCPNREVHPENRRCALMMDNSKDECTPHKVTAHSCKSCDSCELLIDCSEEGYDETPYSCIEKGCLWCPNNRNESNCRYGTTGYRCVSEQMCNIQFPRFQNIAFSLAPNQRPHLEKLMEVLCYSQMGVWAPSTLDRCLAASPFIEAPLARDLTKIYHYFHYYYNYYN